MFINFSNHPSNLWGEKQRNEALKYGDIIDIGFPNVSAASDEKEILECAKGYVDQIAKYDNPVVMVQGEFTLTYAVVEALLERNIKVVSSCTERIAKVNVLEDGKSEKSSVFEFVRFREYTHI